MLDKLLYPYQSPFGELFLGFTPKGVIYHCDTSPPDSGSCCIPRYALTADEDPPDSVKRVFEQLDRYFDGELMHFSIPLAPKGTDFQRKVWKAVLSVPYGEQVSYQRIAEQIDAPRAQRAVGRAVGANPILIFIPCHRIVPASGKLGSYRAGKKFKKQLIDLETRNSK